MWNSIESLGRISSTLNAVIAFSGFLAAAAAVFAWCVSSRLSTLQENRDKEKDRIITQLQDAQRGRQLSASQTASLRMELERLPRLAVYLQGIQGDRESVGFARQLKPVFESVEWKVDGVWEDGLVGGAGEGILVRKARSDTNSSAVRLVEILNSYNLQVRLIEMDNHPTGLLQVIVGTRPSGQTTGVK